MPAEYPYLLYRDGTEYPHYEQTADLLVVKDADEEAAAVADGWARAEDWDNASAAPEVEVVEDKFADGDIDRPKPKPISVIKPKPTKLPA